MDIIDKITKNAKNIKEDEVQEWVVPGLISYFSPKFSYYAYQAYGPSESDLPRKAYTELASQLIEKAAYTYFFKTQQWRLGKRIDVYMGACLKRLSLNIKKEIDSKKYTQAPVCPACKTNNHKSFLTYSDKNLICTECLNAQDDLELKLKREPSVETESELKFRRIFAIHSRKGYKCPDCTRFIPHSYINSEKVSCPYPKCSWFGTIQELEIAIHPLAIKNVQTSLNQPISNDSDKKDEIMSLLKDNNNLDADKKIEISQTFERDLSIINTVIEYQKRSLLNEPKYKCIKKIIMYEAFESMIKKFPEEMVLYLARQSVAEGELPIQARIFQEFLTLIENELPIEIYHNGEVVEIYSIHDSRLDLFTGFSEFEASIKPDGFIPNLTNEVYIGGRKGKERGPCFIGKLVSIHNKETGEPLIRHVEYYTFSQIKMSSEIPVGLDVIVKHFRIPSHYEMNGLVYLQRIRRKIVDSVYQRIHGKKRVVT